MSKRFVKKLKKDYTLNHTEVGWWVDGKCGYQVCGYFETSEECIKEFLSRLKIAKEPGTAYKPIWYFD